MISKACAAMRMASSSLPLLHPFIIKLNTNENAMHQHSARGSRQRNKEEEGTANMRAGRSTATHESSKKLSPELDAIIISMSAGRRYIHERTV
jgi:hypothetical protein